MLREPSKLLSQLQQDQATAVLNEIRGGKLSLFPIRDCVKFFVRMNDVCELTYARNKKDLGTITIPASEIVEDISTPELQEKSRTALVLFESVYTARWPFLPGSHSWLELEIDYKNNILRVPRVVRLSALGRCNIETTTLSDRVASRHRESLSGIERDGWRFFFLVQEQVGFRMIEEDDPSSIMGMLIEENKHHQLGFYMYTDFGKIRVIERKKQEHQAEYSNPLPVGVMK